PARQARLIQGPISRPTVGQELLPALATLVRPGHVLYDPLLHSPRKELHVHRLPPEAVLSPDLLTTAGGTLSGLDHHLLVQRERQRLPLGPFVDPLKALLGSDVHPLTLVVEIGALVDPFQIRERKCLPTVMGPFALGLREILSRCEPGGLS